MSDLPTAQPINNDSVAPLNTTPSSNSVVSPMIATEGTAVDSDYLKKVNEEVYKRSVQLANLNKTLSLLENIYQISLLPLDVQAISEMLTRLMRDNLDYEFVGLYRYNAESDTLNALNFSKSEELIAFLTSKNIVLKDFPITKVSEKPFWGVSVKSKVSNQTSNPYEVWGGIISDDVLLGLTNDAHIGCITVNPLVIEDHTVGVILLGTSKTFDEIHEQEKELLKTLMGAISVSLDKALIFERLSIINNDLSESNEKLKTLDQQKNQFLSFATHQLKSPLTAMKWGMETLREMDFTPEDIDQHKVIVDKLYDTTNDLIRTVTDLLDISKIEQGGLVLKTEPFIWNDYVKKVADEFTIPAKKKGLELVIAIPATQEQINGDQTKLRQVLVNIIDNAIKYTPTGVITVSVVNENGQLHTTVSDTGPGIDATELTQLFAKFARGAAGKDGGGSGLGLFLAKKVMELHGGSVSVTSQGIGYGSQFHIMLPVFVPAQTAVAEAPKIEGQVVASVTPVDTTINPTLEQKNGL